MVKPLFWRAVPPVVGLLALGLMFVGVTGCGNDQSNHDPGHQDDHPSSPAKGAVIPDPKPYPLDYCLISNQKLGSMGEPKRIVYEGQEIKFCCGGCEKKFRKESAKFLKQMADSKNK